MLYDYYDYSIGHQSSSNRKNFEISIRKKSTYFTKCMIEYFDTKWCTIFTTMIFIIFIQQTSIALFIFDQGKDYSLLWCVSVVLILFHDKFDGPDGRIF